MTKFFIYSCLLSPFATSFAIAQTTLTEFSGRGNRAEKRFRRIEQAKQYGDNIIRLSPFRIIDNDELGVGIEYERIFGSKKNFSVVLPFTMSFSDGQYINSNNSNNLFVYFSPGLKIYPFGQRKLTYAVGPSVILGYGQQLYTDYRTGFPGVTFESRRFRFGILANNYLNIQLTPQFNFGVELGVGVRYLNKELNDVEELNNLVAITQNVAFSFGLRF